MSDFRRLLAHVARQCAAAVGLFALAMVWLGLGMLAVAQVYVATREELSVPDFVLRRLEQRIEEAGFRVVFDRATFDPTGRILVQSPRVFLPGYPDAVVTAAGAYVGLSPWPALVGRLDVREIRLIDGNVFVPAMLSPSGRPEPIVRDIDALIVPGDRETLIRHVSGRVSGLVVSVHGAVAHARGRPGRSPAAIVEQVRARFPEFCRGAVEFTRRLEAFEQPSLELTLEPSVAQGAVVVGELRAAGLKLEAPFPAQLGQLTATTQFPLLGDTPTASRLDLLANDIRLPSGFEVTRLSLSMRGRVRPAELTVTPVGVDVFAETVLARDGRAEAISGVARPRSDSQWDGEFVARVLGSEVGVAGAVDLKQRTATVRLAGSISPDVMATISARTSVDVRKFFDFDALDCLALTADFGSDWKFQHLTGRVALRGINAHGVRMDEGFATLDLTPTRFYSPDAYARIGENFARGTYEHDFATHEFRFLLNGQLRPLDISEWFQSWWSNFFARLQFPVAPPVASVDVHGFWREGRRTSVFVFADVKSPLVMGQKLSRVRTRLFIRPGFYDGLELVATDPADGVVAGVFTFTNNVDSGEWRHVEFAGRTSVSLQLATGIAGEAAKSIFSPFELAGSPVVFLRGAFDGPDMSGVRHQQLDLDARSRGSFRFYGLPFEDVAFTTKIRDDEITIDANEGRFAGGAIRLHAKLSGPDAERRLGFDAALDDASLGVTVAALQTFAAQRKNQPPPPAGKFVQEKTNVRLHVAMSADGLYGNMTSFKGGGNASLRGAEIGAVPLFGPLSELLKFTELRFTEARSSFKINGAKIEFPDVTLRGANSALDAHGEYAVDRRQLDFRVKVFPFQESGSVIKTVVGAVLTPISNVLEVKLTGTLEKPDWAFVIGPTNFFRSLSSEEPGAEADAKAPVAEKPPETPAAATVPNLPSQAAPKPN